MGCYWRLRSSCIMRHGIDGPRFSIGWGIMRFCIGALAWRLVRSASGMGDGAFVFLSSCCIYTVFSDGEEIFLPPTQNQKLVLLKQGVFEFLFLFLLVVLISELRMVNLLASLIAAFALGDMASLGFRKWFPRRSFCISSGISQIGSIACAPLWPF